MDIVKGFQIEQPNLFVPWGISRVSLVKECSELDFTKISADYVTAKCISLHGLRHEIGFHFHPIVEVGLFQISFFGIEYTDGVNRFDIFQEHLEATFGRPLITGIGEDGSPEYSWKIGDIEIMHCVVEHFGPAEMVNIAKSRVRS